MKEAIGCTATADYWAGTYPSNRFRPSGMCHDFTGDGQCSPCIFKGPGLPGGGNREQSSKEKDQLSHLRILRRASFPSNLLFFFSTNDTTEKKHLTLTSEPLASPPPGSQPIAEGNPETRDLRPVPRYTRNAQLSLLQLSTPPSFNFGPFLA